MITRFFFLELFFFCVFLLLSIPIQIDSLTTIVQSCKYGFGLHKRMSFKIIYVYQFFVTTYALYACIQLSNKMKKIELFIECALCVQSSMYHQFKQSIPCMQCMNHQTLLYHTLQSIRFMLYLSIFFYFSLFNNFLFLPSLRIG